MKLEQIIDKYLGSYKEVSSGNLQVKTCPFCGKNDGKFYIRKDTGVYICHHGSCNAKGNLKTLISHLEKKFNVKLSVDEEKKTIKTKAQASIRKLNSSDFHTLTNGKGEENTDARKTIEYLNSRGISAYTAWKLNTLSRKSDNSLAFFYLDLDNKVKSVKYRSIYEKRLSQEAGSQAILWNIQGATNKNIIICEGEWDCLTLAECGLFDRVLSVPMGTGNLDWIDNCKEYLESKDEIILAFDNDDAGEKALRKVAQRLQNLNLKKINLGNYKDINDFYLFEGKEAVLKLVENTEIVEIQGIESLYETNRFDINDIERFKLGIPTLDKSLRGAKEGELIVLAGDNGSGKTTITKQFMLAARNMNKKVFVVNGEIQNNIFKEDLFLQANGDNKLLKIEDKLIKGEFDWKVTDENYNKINEWLNGYLFSMSNTEDLTDVNVLSKIETAIIKNNVFFIVVDNLSVIQCSGENEANAKGEFTAKLKNLAVKYGVCILLVNHFTKGNKERGQEAIKGSGKITDVADIVLIIERENNIQSDYDGKLRITKNRLKGSLADIKLYFSGRYKTLMDTMGSVTNYNWNKFDDEIDITDIPF